MKCVCKELLLCVAVGIVAGVALLLSPYEISDGSAVAVGFAVGFIVSMRPHKKSPPSYAARCAQIREGVGRQVDLSHHIETLCGKMAQSTEEGLQLAIKPHPWWLPAWVHKWLLGKLLRLERFQTYAVTTQSMGMDFYSGPLGKPWQPTPKARKAMRDAGMEPGVFAAHRPLRDGIEGKYASCCGAGPGVNVTVSPLHDTSEAEQPPVLRITHPEEWHMGTPRNRRLEKMGYLHRAPDKGPRVYELHDHLVSGDDVSVYDGDSIVLSEELSVRRDGACE
jgi:hypothetical protein